MRSLVDLRKINLRVTEIHRVHPATDIDADHIGNRFISNRHCRSNGTALTGVDVRHNSDLGAFRHSIIAHASDLLDSFILHYSRVADCRIHFSLDL